MAEAIRLVVADDHPVMREDLVALLEDEPDLKVIGQASTGREAITLVRLHRLDYERNGYLFVNYTRKSDWATIIARYTVSKNPDKADPDSALILLTVAQPYANHKGGQLAFSPIDGYLYVGLGDGGYQWRPQQSRSKQK